MTAPNGDSDRVAEKDRQEWSGDGSEGRCLCDGAAFYTDDQNRTRAPFLAHPDCPIHERPEVTLETDRREPDNAPSYAATKAERYYEQGTFGGMAPNLFACSFCGAVVAYPEIPLHTKWHQDIAELLALEAAR